MHKMTTQKKWEDLLPPASISLLLKALDNCRQTPHTSCLFLFYGEEAGKKQAAAALTAMHMGKTVQHVQTPSVISTYIGETEKNLRQVFDAANAAGTLLFFDEADALFSKRTEIADSHDRYSNQEISYLLKEIKAFKHPVMVAVKDKTAIAASVLRSFNTVIHFPVTGK